MQLNLFNHFQRLLKKFHQQCTFKVCSMCGKKWYSMDEFLSDTSLEYNGYQSGCGVCKYGLFYFTHSGNDCGSTMSLKAQAFYPLYIENKCCSKEISERDCMNCSLAERKLTQCSLYCEHIFPTEIAKLMAHYKGESNGQPDRR